MAHFEIEIPLGQLQSARVETALFDAGASAVTFVDGGDDAVLEPAVGEVRLWTQSLVRGLFDDSLDPTLCLAQLSASLGDAAAIATIRRVAERPWEREWLKTWRPLRFGRRLWILPHGFTVPDQIDTVVVRLDPGLAFGTGTHPTTALCLEALDALPLTDRTLIDYGCGSGILAISALRLGAAHAIAIDIDPQALIATRDNAALNHVAGRLRVQAPGEDTEPADYVMANILAGPLTALSATLTSLCRPQGALLLSGILESQVNAVSDAYRGFDIVSCSVRESWCCIEARRR
jgi:ribosomal protein L11 methyltransferase